MSAAKIKFDRSISEIDDLMAIHVTITSGAVGRPTHKVAVLNKSGVVLVCAFWQAYCEDVLLEALVTAKTAALSKVPAGTKSVIATRLVKSDVTEAWKLAGKGWKDEVDNLVTFLSGDRTRPLDTPSSKNVSEVFKRYLSIEDITKTWKWAAMSVVNSRTTLDDFIQQRHRVAHRGTASTSITKTGVEAFQNHVTRLVDKTDAEMHRLGLV